MKSKHPAYQIRRTIKRSAYILLAGTILSFMAISGIQVLYPAVAHAGTAFVFTGQTPKDPSHSLWTIPDNWTPSGIPGPNDDVLIGCTHLVQGIPPGTVIHGLTLECSGSSLSCRSSNFGATCDGDLTVTGTFNWTGGRLITPLTVPAGGVVSISGGTLTTDGMSGAGVLNLAGTTVLSGPLAFGGFDGPAFLNNAGTFTAARGASMTGLACCQNPSQFKNTGTLINKSSRGTTTIAEMALANTGTIRLLSGVLSLNFIPVQPGVPSFTEPRGATLRVTIRGTTPGTGFGQLQVSGLAALAGKLVVTNAGGFLPTPGQTFKVITCGTACNGTFRFASVSYSVQYHPQDVTLNALSPPPDPRPGVN